MRAVLLVVAARFRRGWRAWLLLSLLVALVSGVAMAAATAGRRAATAFPRYVAEHGFDVAVYSVRPLPGLTRLPEVRQVVPGATDTQCGFKFFAGPLARAAARSLRTAGFAFDIELIAACQRLGATLTEIPVDWRDVPGSTFSVSRHSAAAMRDVAAIWLRYRAGRGPGTVPDAAPAPAPAAVTTA